MGNLAELRDLLEEACGGLPAISIRRMFGCDGFFAGETIFGLIWKTGRIGLKLPDLQVFHEAMSLSGSDPWAAGPRVMAHWVLLPESFHRDPVALRSWAGHAYAMAMNPPPGAKKAPAKKKIRG